MTSNKKIISLILVFGILFSFTGCLRYTSNILDVTPGSSSSGGFELETLPNSGNQQGGNQQGGTQQGGTQQGGTQQGGTQQGGTQQGGTQQGDTQTNPTEPDNQGGNATVNPANWTTTEILAYATNAITKTKAYSSQVTVNHSESFEVNVTKAPGGKTIQSVANGIIESVVKPTDEVLTFNGGKTVNSEGETVPLLLPKRGAFTLTPAGVASATASQNGDNIIISIKLVKEVGTLTDHPQHHAASVGYLDASDVDLGIVTLNYLDITYTGTTLDLLINSDGYVVQAVYKIPIEISCEGKAMGITAQIECVGQQSENWKINW